MDRGALRATVHWVPKELDRTWRLNNHHNKIEAKHRRWSGNCRFPHFPYLAHALHLLSFICLQLALQNPGAYHDIAEVFRWPKKR